MEAILDLLNINGCPAVRTMKASKHCSMHFMGGEELTKICSNSYTVRPANSHMYIWWCQLTIEYQWQCFIQAVPTMNSSKYGHLLGGEELTKICPKCDRRTQSELHTFLPLQYTSAMGCYSWSKEMPRPSCSKDERLQALCQCISWVVRSWQKFCVRRTQSDLHTLPCIVI